MTNSLFIPKDAALRNAVLLFWQVNRIHLPFRQETIIPKGIVEIVFNFHAPEAFYAQIDGRHIRLPKCFINGFNTHPVQLHLADRQESFGVVFYPGALQRILGVPAGEFANHCIDMTLVDPAFYSLWHHLAEQPAFYDRISVFSGWIKDRLPCLNAQEQAFNVFLYKGTDSAISVSKLSEWLCYSPRHLSRKLKAITGMNTEQTLLYKKYLKAIRLMHHSGLSLTETGYACHFADQSHFVRTFKQFSSITPKEYLNRKTHIVGHFFDDVR